MKKPPTSERQALQKLLNITKLIRERHWEAYSPSERNRLNNAINLCHIVITAKPPSNSLPVDLSLNESGHLCNMMMTLINNSGGIEKQHSGIIQLYQKLAKANDFLMSRPNDLR